MVIAEWCWVLQSPHYNYTPAEIGAVLAFFVTAKGIDVDEQDVILDALENYSPFKVDFIDAYIAARAKMEGPAYIATYNAKDFRKLGVPFDKPHQVN